MTQSFLAAILLCAAAADGPASENRPLQPTVLNKNAGWCWFQDERAIVVDGRVLVGSVACSPAEPARRGNVEAVVYDPAAGPSPPFVLHANLQSDDHDLPAFLRRADGRVLALYSMHGNENCIYQRLTTSAGDVSAWGEERRIVPSESSRVTYNNLFNLSAENGGRGRIYNFFRGYDNHFKPSCMTSDDGGETWQQHGLWITMPSEKRHRPYVKYASNDRDVIHFAFTEGHPDIYDNSLYHAYYRDGKFYRSNGEPIGAAADGPVEPRQATRIFAGSAAQASWVSDLHLDADERPVVVSSVSIEPRKFPHGDPQAGADHRYRYARWDGSRWNDHEIARAGPRLYAGQEEYTGNICLDPHHLDRVFISTTIDPTDGRPTSGGHFELFEGRTPDGGATWRWAALTPGATEDQLRPIMPRWDADHCLLMWVRGEYRSYTDYDLEIVAADAPLR